MGDFHEENASHGSITNLISTYFERSTLEAELRAHKALSILHARDVQVEELQLRVAELQCAAVRAGERGGPPPGGPNARPARAVHAAHTASVARADDHPEAHADVPPLRLPPSPGSDPGDAAVAASRASTRITVHTAPCVVPRANARVTLRPAARAPSPSSPSEEVCPSPHALAICRIARAEGSDEAHDKSRDSSCEDSAVSSNSLVSDSLSNPLTSSSSDSNSAAIDSEMVPPPSGFGHSHSDRAPSPHTPPLSGKLPAAAAEAPQNHPCHLAVEADNKGLPQRFGGSDRESASCMDIERQMKRETFGRRRKTASRPGTQSYPIRAEHAASTALSEEARTTATQRPGADTAPPGGPARDGECPEQPAACSGGVAAAAAATTRRGRASAAGDHASCHRLIDELKLYNNQLRAALLHAKPSPAPVLGPCNGEPVVAMMAEVAVSGIGCRRRHPGAPPPPENFALQQGDAVMMPGTQSPHSSPPPTPTHESPQRMTSLSDLAEAAQGSEVLGVALETERLRRELTDVRRRFGDLQATHLALQEQVRQQEVVEQLKRKTMQELRERLAHLERSVAAGDLDTSDSEAVTDASTPAPPRWVFEAAMGRSHKRAARGEGAAAMASRSVQAGLCCGVGGMAAGEVEQRLRAAERDAEEQRQNNRLLAERLRHLSQAAAHEVELQQQRCQRIAEKALKQRVRSICRTVADAYGLNVRPEELLRNPRAPDAGDAVDIVAARSLSAIEASEGSSVASRRRRQLRRSHIDAASRRTCALRKQLRALRVQYSRAKRKIARQDRCLKAKQVYHTFLEKTLSKLRGDLEEMQREMMDTKMENDRLLQRVRVLQAAEAAAAAAAVAEGAAHPATPATPSSSSRRQSSKSPVARIRRFSISRPQPLAHSGTRTLSLPARPLSQRMGQVQPATPSRSRPLSPGVTRPLSPRPRSPQPLHAPSAPAVSPPALSSNSASASVPASLSLTLSASVSLPSAPAVPLAMPPAILTSGGAAPDENPQKAEEAHRRQLLSARLRAATQNIAALNKAVSTLRHQLKATEESLQRCKERLIRSESCNQNRLMLVESYKVKTHDLEMRLDEAITKSNSQAQTIDALKNQNCNLKCQVSKIIAQRDEYMQEGLKIKKTLGEEITRTANEIQSRLVSESEQKVQEVKQQCARHTLEQNKKLKEATQKLNQFGHAIEGFLKLLQQRQMAAMPEMHGGDERPPRREALARAASILNLTPAQLRNFMNDPGEVSRQREMVHWMTYCRRLFSRELFAQLLAEFLFKVVLTKFEPETSLESSVYS